MKLENDSKNVKKKKKEIYLGWFLPANCLLIKKKKTHTEPYQ